MNVELLDSPVFLKLLYLLITIVLVYFFTLVVKKGLNKVIKSTDNKYRARKASNVVGYIILIIAIIGIYSEQLGTLGMALGVAGAGVAFALQEVIMSFAGWLVIVFTNKVEVGQRIKIGDLKGDIIDIGMMSTTFMEMGDWVKSDQYNGRIVSIANSYVFKEKIQNYSAEYPFLWDEVQIPIRHESDYHLARELFEKVALEICGEYADQSKKKWQSLTNKYRVENADVNPMISMEFDQNWITFTIRFVVDYKKRRSTKDQIFTSILKEISQHKDRIEIATTAMEVTIPKE